MVSIHKAARRFDALKTCRSSGLDIQSIPNCGWATGPHLLFVGAASGREFAPNAREIIPASLASFLEGM